MTSKNFHSKLENCKLTGKSYLYVFSKLTKLKIDTKRCIV